jgi:hypothetical protein
MANRTIPELSEIDLVDVTADQLLVLDDGNETFKVRMSTLANFFLSANRFPVSVVFDGMETGEKTVDVTSLDIDATVFAWTLKKPTTGEQITAVIKTPDAATVIIDTGDFALDAGNYTLLGV